MRARLLLTGITLGATVLVGGATAAQAAPAPSQAGTTSTATAAAGRWVYDGSYSESVCYSLAASYAGPAYCTPNGSKWALFIWVED
ncbi:MULTISPECIES: hypothetical protein [Streptomyces]|uniref:Secreted protein n=1 Tax=Streptomyces tricolor TaxID=68277 RepID=A0ABS9JSN3_9ACTN|nr:MULTISPECIES: hypothetical protein [Streptomyces]MYU27086.1 hypothetical protein [Streptomyces sp. SID7810]CUW25924.1 hypothetical protein TUE45_00634 [Streptomyces reticuli]MCG0068568.1 hypothetical protein [Streptomyces tricolor]OYP13408.1 hypothetical protein CFC35_01950 [Streptomyces sp. FBKL.4005]BCM65136.1 hypothetical protein EASAB2608_00470 [Streptomyces sp. EAS-AB2608]